MMFKKLYNKVFQEYRKLRPELIFILQGAELELSPSTVVKGDSFGSAPCTSAIVYLLHIYLLFLILYHPSSPYFTPFCMYPWKKQMITWSSLLLSEQ